MNYLEEQKIRKEMKKLDLKRSKLYKEYAEYERKQDNTKCSDFYSLCSQKMEEIQEKLNFISEKNEELSDLI